MTFDTFRKDAMIQIVTDHYEKFKLIYDIVDIKDSLSSKVESCTCRIETNYLMEVRLLVTSKKKIVKLYDAILNNMEIYSSEFITSNIEVDGKEIVIRLETIEEQTEEALFDVN